MKMIRALLVLLGVAMTAALAVAQNQIIAEANKQSEMSAPSSPDKSFQERRPRYRLQAGDVFDISFELNPEFNQTVTVQPDGFITLRGIGDVAVKGETVPELTETLRQDYSKILNAPLISVVLKDFEKPYFIADGQVGHPGKYDLRGDVTLTEAIAMSGGFLESAKHSQVLLFRKASQGWYSAQIFNVKKMEKKGDLKEDPTLQAGDMLFVPKNRYSKLKPFIPGSSMGAFVPLQP
ncbi:MAG TPA: polysaccharide biosynthesis/export family protein [Candidatus Sulfotelmatobacter sp.]|nr:polysaccharide biosynthesis/export family protein [Candidatus Sulfotelmatobacter sp.]